MREREYCSTFQQGIERGLQAPFIMLACLEHFLLISPLSCLDSSMSRLKKFLRAKIKESYGSDETTFDHPDYIFNDKKNAYGYMVHIWIKHIRRLPDFYGDIVPQKVVEKMNMHFPEGRCKLVTFWPVLDKENKMDEEGRLAEIQELYESIIAKMHKTAAQLEETFTEPTFVANVEIVKFDDDVAFKDLSDECAADPVMQRLVKAKEAQRQKQREETRIRRIQKKTAEGPSSITNGRRKRRRKSESDAPNNTRAEEEQERAPTPSSEASQTSVEDAHSEEESVSEEHPSESKSPMKARAPKKRQRPDSDSD
jgi:hypothetical protein